MKFIKSLNFLYFKISRILKWELRKQFQLTFHFFYINIPNIFLKRINLNREVISKKIDIYVIAFNNFDAIQLQYEKLTKYLIDEFNYIIVDNSTSKEVRKNLYNYCNDKELVYVSLPYQKVFKISASHSLALNWISRNLLKKRRTSIVGFIDHDIFPIKMYSISDSLIAKPFYGVRHFAITPKNKTMWGLNTPEYWYLWPGFMFFNYQSIKDLRLNFMPLALKGIFFDTGGELYKIYYSKLNQLNISWFAHHHWAQISPERGVDVFDRSWVHISNASDWRGVNEKLDYLRLSQIIKSVKSSFGD